MFLLVFLCFFVSGATFTANSETKGMWEKGMTSTREKKKIRKAMERTGLDWVKLLLRYVAGWHNYAVLCVIEKLQFHKISIPLTEDISALDPRHPAWNFHSMGGGGECLSYPPPPGISVIFQLGWVPSGKNICVKNVVARYYNFSWDKMKKYIFSFMLVWCLIISRTFFVNNQL